MVGCWGGDCDAGDNDWVEGTELDSEAELGLVFVASD